jgi:hypothetical protein
MGSNAVPNQDYGSGYRERCAAPGYLCGVKTVNICGLCLNQPETRRGFEVSKRRKRFLTERHLDAASPERLGEGMGHA